MTDIQHVAESEDVSFFSPQNCSFQTLENTLTSSRREVAETLLKRIGEAVKKPVSEHSHLLLTGAEGAGKTHVLAYVAGRLRDEFDVEEVTLIPLFDENREIANLFDFLVACIRAAGHFSEEELLERIEDFDGDPTAGATDLSAR